MKVGVPRESAPGERRVALVPDVVKRLGAKNVEVVVEAVLEKVEGRRLTFHVAVNDRGGLVAAGRVTRVLVDTDRFKGKTHH